MRLLTGDDALAGSTLTRHPERFKVGNGAAGGEVAEKVLAPAEHGGNLSHRLDFHLRAGPAAVASMVVGVDGHGQRVGRARHRMRRFEHLPGVEGVEVGVIVGEPPGHLLKDGGHDFGLVAGPLRHMWRQAGELLFKQI